MMITDSDNSATDIFGSRFFETICIQSHAFLQNRLDNLIKSDSVVIFTR